jgi:N-acetylmuramoyl-L-alanine amidase
MLSTLSRSTLATALALAVASGLPAQQTPSKVILIDAGHGGVDPGATAPSGAREKDLTLALAQQLADALAELGAPVEMVRRADTDVPLRERDRGADEAALFLSIHTGAAPDPSASGTQLFVRPGDEGSRRIAGLLEEQLRALGSLEVAPIREARFVVFNDLPCPGVMLTLGHLTNASDARLVEDPGFQRQVTQAVVAALQAGGFAPASP